MTVGYSIEVDREQIDEVLSLFKFIGGNTDKALRVAINKTGPKIKTLASKKIREQVRLSAKYVGEKLTFTRATGGRLEGRIGAESRGLLLSRYSTDSAIANPSISWFKAPPTPTAGIFVKIKPTGSRKKVGTPPDGASKPFYLLLQNSRQIGIAVRRKSAGSRSGKLKVLHSPSISQVFNTVRSDVMPDAGTELTYQMAEAIRFLLAKRAPTE